MSAACISQRLISHWVIKQGWRDGQFQILLQRLHTSIQPNIMEDPLLIPHPLKNTSMSWPLQKTYSKKSQTSVTEETNQIHSDTSLLSFISPDIFVPAETSAFSKEDTSFPLVCANENASGEELGSVNLYFVVGGTDSNRGNMQHMVQKSVNPAI